MQKDILDQIINRYYFLYYLFLANNSVLVVYSFILSKDYLGSSFTLGLFWLKGCESPPLETSEKPVIESNLPSRCCRRKAPQMRGMLESFQPIFKSHHAHAQTHRIQALLLRPLRESVPKKSRSAKTQRVAASFRLRDDYLQIDEHVQRISPAGEHQTGSIQQQLEIVGCVFFSFWKRTS